MGHRAIRDSIAPLLILLTFGVSAAAQTAIQRAAAEVRAAADRGLWLQAEKKSNDALQRFRATADDAMQEIRVRRGEALLGLGRNDDALQILRPDLPSHLQRSALAVRRLNYLTILALLRGDRAEANRLLSEAQQLATSHQPFTLPEVMLVQAYVDRKNREAILPRALRIARKEKNQFCELRIAQLINSIRLLGGHYVESIRGNDVLITKARVLHYDGVEQKLEGDLGWALFDIGDVEQAAEHFERAERITRETGAVRDRVTWLTQLGNVAYERRDLVAAEKQYRLAYALGQPIHHDQLGLVVANLATIALETGRYDEARRLNAEATAIKKSLGQADPVLRSRIITSQIDAAAGDYEAARRAVESIPSETEVAETRWLAHAQLASVFAAQKKNDDADEQFRRAMTTLHDARAEITDESLRLSFNNDARGVVDDYLDFLVSVHRDEDALKIAETIQGQTLEEGLGIKSRLDPRAIAKQSGASILCYHFGTTHSYVWSITPDTIKLATLPPRSTIHAAIDAYVRDLLGGLGTNESRGMSLWRMLVEPSAIRSGRVIIVADERLNVLNLEALVVPSPKPHYWIEDVVLRTAPSLQILGRTMQARKHEKSLLLIGNAPQVDPAYPSLQRAGLEVDRVRKRFTDATVLAGPKATPAAYRNASPDSFDVVHFVAHGEATTEKPLDSAVILGPDASGYKLFARNIIQQPITARLVTISSCYGAGKRTYVGEGLVGLAWAFLRAGAQQVIAAVWDVSDAATPDLMDAMYANMRAGHDPATALHDAKLALVRSKGAYSRPRYWAPFVLYSGM